MKMGLFYFLRLMKKIVIDFEKIEDPFCGLGQVCLNLGKYFITSPLKPYLWIKKGSWNLFENYDFKIKINKYAKKIPLLRPRCEVFHAIHQDSPYFPYGSKAKYILTVHDLNGLYEIKDETKKERYKSQINKRIQRASAITYISEFTKSEVHQHFNIPANCHEAVIYNGVSLVEPIPAIQETLKLPTNAPYLFSIGTVVPKKNFHVLIEMMLKLPDFHLVIAGTLFHQYAKDMEKSIQQNNLQARIHLIGTIDEQLKYKLYSNAKAFVFPSLLEGFGLPVIEAMSFGLPIIVSRKTSLPEIAGSEAYYFDSYKKDEMAKTVLLAIENHNEEKMNYFKNRAAQFTWKKASDEYLKLYEKFLNKA